MTMIRLRGNIAPVILVAATALSFVSCNKKKSDDSSSSDAATPMVVASGQPASVLGGSGSITLPVSLVGTPPNPNNADSISVSVAGDGLVEYRYALEYEQADCNSVTYSEVRTPDLLIEGTTTDDGTWLLCVLAAGRGTDASEKVASLSYSWLRDAKDPSVSVTAFSGFGPNYLAGDSFAVSVEASDSASGLDSVGLSVRRAGNDCLNAGHTAFNADCPNYLELSPAQTTISIDDDLFVGGAAYEFSAIATDRTGNKKVSALVEKVWDTTPPGAPSSLVATAGQEVATVTWTAVSGASGYIIIRKLGSPVDLWPTGGDVTIGQGIDDDNTVVYVGSNTSFVDTDLTPFAHYHYLALARDTAKNISSSGAAGHCQPAAIPAFQGLTYAYVKGPGRRIGVDWQEFAINGSSTAATEYDLYAADTSGDHNFVGASSAAVTGAPATGFIDDGSGGNTYLIARASAAGIAQEDNTRELRVKFGAGIEHKLTSNGRYLGTDPLTQTFLRNAWATDFDNFGNVLFSAANGTLQVLCRESTQAYYCKGRQTGLAYTIAGTDGIDDGADGALASATPMGQIYGIDVDASGNVFVADYTNYRIRVICYNPLAAGSCNGRSIGFTYHIAGNGAAADGIDDAVAKTTGIGLPNAVAVDTYGNVFFSDSTYRRLRVACFVLSGAVCAGKTIGNSYAVAGNGTLADGADGQVRLSATFGEPRGLTIDTRNNLWFADWDYRRIRALCFDVSSGAGFCTGKTSGNIYRVLGTGAAADGSDNVTASGSGMGQVYGLAVANGNVYISDSTYLRIRVICHDNVAAGFCAGKTVGRVYRIAGSGGATDGANNTLALVAALGAPRHLTVDNQGNIVLADDTNKRLRLICKTPQTNNICSGRFADYHYQVIGTGAATLGWQTDAMATPVGTPQGTAIDGNGNVYFGDATNSIIRVVCYDVEAAGFCNAKVAGNTYFAAGTGVAGDGADDSLAIITTIGIPSAIALDSFGNLYIADSTNRRIRVVCWFTDSGFCSGKTSSNMYRFAGGGAASDGADNTVAAGANFGVPTGMNLDPADNVYFADSSFPRIRVICQSASSGFCNGKTINNIYRHSGTGASANGADNSVAASTGFGVPADVAIDPWGNVLVGDVTFPRIRAICNNTTGGYCSGKTVGNVYWYAGTGTAGDGLSDTTATASAVSSTYGLIVDALGNTYFGDLTYRRLRIVCQDTTAGYCTGLTSGRSFRLYGNAGATTDSASGIVGAMVRLDSPSRDSLALTTAGELIYAGSSGAVRLFGGYP